MNKTIVIYHSADFDGLFCREIARHFIPDAHFIGWDYGQPIPTMDQIRADDTVYMLDISIDKWMDHPKLIWIDHHKSAIEKFGDGIAGWRIDGVAACRLAWQFFSLWGNTEKLQSLPIKRQFIDREVSEPLAVRLAGEYDIWDKRDPRAELLQHGLRSQELNEMMWELMLVNQQHIGTATGNKYDIGTITVEALLERGEAIQYAKTQENESIIRSHGFTIQFEGLTFLACNHARYNSFLFTAGLTPEHDACLGFAWKGGKWTVSLYHAPGKEHHDLSLIAAKYGGGGHKGACGMQMADLPFLKAP